MSARSRPTPADPFVYSDEQWAGMRAIVERAGNVAARDKFDAQRTIFEKMVGRGKWRIENWDGQTLGQDAGAIYRRIKSAARKLNEALAELNHPAIFIGHELVWKALAETSENQRRYSEFCAALEHVGARAALIEKKPRKRDRLMREWFVRDLAEVWRDELGLKITAGTKSLFVKFVVAACASVCSLKAQTVVNIMQAWPRRQGRKNDGEKS
jgi:hypothetical protein